MPSAIGPMARRLLLAMAILPPAAYGARKAYQHFHGSGEDEAKEASLRRYGLRKEALSPAVRNMLLGAGVGGVVGAGLNYAFHHDKPDAGSRAVKAGLGGALVGTIAGGLATPNPAPVAPKAQVRAPYTEAMREADQLRDVARPGAQNRAHQELVDHLVHGPNSTAASWPETFEEFDRRMLDPDYVWEF